MAEVTERPVTFGRHGHLFGLLTSPSDIDPSLPSLVVLNAGIIHRVGPSRLGPTIARILARSGIRVLRFDLSGIGDSSVMDAADLSTIVRLDVRDAIDLVAAEAGVVLFGLCSGADNAFSIGAEDDRVRGVVLIDPTVGRTRGFAVREAVRKVSHAGPLWNLLTGRALIRRLKARTSRGIHRPPHYGLLVGDAKETRDRARTMTGRGVEFLFVLTGGVRNYCNSPRQIEESMPDAFDGNLQIEWRPEADHLLTRSEDRSWLQETVLEWLQALSSTSATTSDT